MTKSSYLCTTLIVKIMKTTIAIGDIHGLNTWIDIVKNNPDYRIIFLGDYLDPYHYVSRSSLIKNLNAIIELKKSRPEDVILLLGNHDMHYLTPDIPLGTRYDTYIAEKASQTFLDNIDLFQYAYQEEEKIFVHAGISHDWFIDDFKGNLNADIAEQLNHPTTEQITSLYRVGGLRGGYPSDKGGIFWADIDELTDPLHGYTQIVGHNRVRKITERSGDYQNKIIFCDSLFNGEYLMIKELNDECLVLNARNTLTQYF